PDCPHCERSFPAKKALEDHVQRAHPGAPSPGASKTPYIVAGLVVLAGLVTALALLGGGGGDVLEDRFHLSTSPHQGDLDAPVALIAFESPACSSCRLFHVPRGDDTTSVLDKVNEQYVAEGKLLYVEKYARAGYRWETMAAHGQKCAYNELGTQAFFDLTEAFYDQQASLSRSNVLSFLQGWAQGNGHDAQALVDCTQEERYQDQITQDLGDGEVAGVLGTPTFILVHPDGETERVPLGSFATFANAIEKALEKAPEPAEGPQASGNGTTQAPGNETS
ncbi:MAG: thioredoxin domain-containing protein, partial [Candidatus Thermoplasmatota archaeon]|nr:thioredoxin domain-containing protein [Candidatus Thermoplasmatota archaeon]